MYSSAYNSAVCGEMSDTVSDSIRMVSTAFVVPCTLLRSLADGTGVEASVVCDGHQERTDIFNIVAAHFFKELS